ncbi:MAG: FkbM family methyltransferase [Pseudomonadota bacterium]
MSFDIKRSNWLRTTLVPKRLTHIVDVGANPAEEVPYAPLLQAGGCHLTGFEPQQHAYEKLLKIKGPNETYHCFAVGDGQKRPLHLMAHDTMTSFYKGRPKGTQYLRRFGPALEIKETVELDTVALDQSEVTPFDLLKIDIQGGETIVFDGADDHLKHAVAVIPEVRWYQLYEDEPMFAGVDIALRKRGFALHKFMFNKALILPTSQYNAMMPGAHTNQLIDGDAVYIKDMADLGQYSAERLKHLAILADGVWFSFDLVVRCLDILVTHKVIDPRCPADYVKYLPAPYVKNPTPTAN